MNKLVVSFVLAFMLLSIGLAVFDGGGYAVTSLTAPVNGTANSLTVTSTTGFLSSGVLFVENEKVSYTAIDATHFNNVTRGIEQTTAISHATGKQVYCEDAGIINAAMGFNPAAIAATNGYYAALMIPWDFFTITMPRLLLWNFNIFNGGMMEIVRIVLIGVSMCFYITFAIQLGQTIAQILHR